MVKLNSCVVVEYVSKCCLCHYSFLEDLCVSINNYAICACTCVHCLCIHCTCNITCTSSIVHLAINNQNIGL